MANPSDVQQFVVLPTRGLVASVGVPVRSFLLGMASAVGLRSFPEAAGLSIAMRVLDSIHENGAKLVEMSPETISQLRASHPGLRVVPVTHYSSAVAPRPEVLSKVKPKAAGVAVSLRLQVVSKTNGQPVRGATVVAFTDFAAREGAQGITDASGRVRLTMGGASKKVERLYIFPQKDFWGRLSRNVKLQDGMKLSLRPLDLGSPDALRHFYGPTPAGSGQGVVVGVVDTGVAAHPNLVIQGGENTVVGEKSNDFGDNGAGHGTHVAGIIAARGTPPKGVRGVAPEVSLRSYRVFGKNKERASNFSIAKAIDRAVQQGCDLLNMSLGGPDPDEATREAIADAHERGTLVFCAAGNDEREPVNFPASDSLAVAVSAMGRKGTFPSDSISADSVASPRGSDPKNFVADFSNKGPEIDLTGPGVGILSTFPGGYAEMDGTSMACPAATGLAARILSGQPQILKMTRDAARTQAMMQAVVANAKKMGFGAVFEGQGLLKV